jgi:hypothetical protein
MMDVEDEQTTWARLLAYVTGLVNQELLLQNEVLGGRKPHFEGASAARLSDG